MADIRKILATAGKVAASVVLNTYLPGAGGIIQQVENLHGANTGTEKKALATKLATDVLESLAKSGKLAGAAPVLAEVEAAVQAVVTAMKADGTLEEAGVLKLAGQSYQVIVLGKLPE